MQWANWQIISKITFFLVIVLIILNLLIVKYLSGVETNGGFGVIIFWFEVVIVNTILSLILGRYYYLEYFEKKEANKREGILVMLLILFNIASPFFIILNFL